MEVVRTGSAQWNIFMGVRVFVDHRRMIPSREPEANRFAVCVCVCVCARVHVCVCVRVCMCVCE